LKKILFVFGTRPEAIKLAPVIRSVGDSARIAVTAQHRGMLDQVLNAFSIRPHHDLDLMRPGQSLFDSTSRIVAALEPVLETEQPDFVVVQGDTTTAMCAALGGFYKHIRVAHVEAGLRTGDVRQPFPEEMNRVLIARLASLHFAPTKAAAQNLLREGIETLNIFVTGNTSIDSVLYVRDQIDNGAFRPMIPVLRAGRKLILVTGHRRESFGPGFECICRALRKLAARPDVEVVYPVHPNPSVNGPVKQNLAGSNVRLIEPLGYIEFVALMARAYVMLTDSGGIQEEAPSLGKPVLVMREKTERPEAVEAGTTRLVGTDEQLIVMETERLLDDNAEYERRSRVHNPYGDGHASERIRDVLLNANGGL
jgi:UDP-N-acetylglucosamine 2-epimerase (non-hydrolysing)